MMFLLFTVAAVVALVLVARAAFAANLPDVRINEIAWMGTEQSASDEWIELYNAGPTPIDIIGWRLAADDDTPSIELAGTIAGGEYFLLERTDDASVPTIPADIIYQGALSNSGEILKLTETDGTLIDSVAGWQAGDNTTKQTMARTDDKKWQNGIAGGTPKASNAFALVSTPPKKTLPAAPSDKPKTSAPSNNKTPPQTTSSDDVALEVHATELAPGLMAQTQTVSASLVTLALLGGVVSVGSAGTLLFLRERKKDATKAQSF